MNVVHEPDLKKAAEMIEALFDDGNCKTKSVYWDIKNRRFVVIKPTTRAIHDVQIGSKYNGVDRFKPIGTYTVNPHVEDMRIYEDLLESERLGEFNVLRSSKTS